MPYLAANDFNPVLQYLAGRFPTISSLITLPEQTHEGRTVQGLRIGKPASDPKRAVLLFGGCHARELVNPDLLLEFASEMLHSYAVNADLVFGNVLYEAQTVKIVLDSIDVIVVPLINPDGRAFVQSTDPMWRKNRRPNAGSTCIGTDINRNYDILWSANLNSSPNPCSYELHKGSAPFSEAETRNVRWLLDNFPHIEAMIDVHSYSELVVHPWSIDETQTTDPNMSFQNPAFNGQRGVMGDAYREYMPPKDLERFRDMGFRMRNKIQKVRGHCYRVIPGVEVYNSGVSGSSKDYAYSRHRVDATKRKVFAYTLETGRQFQPPVVEAMQVIEEVCAGLFEFCIANCCPIISGASQQPNCAPELATALDLFYDSKIARTPIGKRYRKLITGYLVDVRDRLPENKSLYTAVVRLVRYIDQVAQYHFADPPRPLDARLLHNLDRALDGLERARGLGKPFKRAVASVRADLVQLEGKTLADGLKTLSANTGRARKSSSE